MKILIRFLVIAAVCFTMRARATWCLFSITNLSTQTGDTNAIQIIPAGNVLASGNLQTMGSGFWIQPDTNGLVITNLIPGQYQAYNDQMRGNFPFLASAGKGVVFAVPQDASTNIWPVFALPPTGLAISGFNLFSYPQSAHHS